MSSLQEEVKNIKQILAPGDIAHIALQMLGCINKEITNHTLRSAYITLSIAQAYPFAEGGNVQNLVVLSLLHTIGFFREEPFFNYNPHDSNIDYFSDTKEVFSKYVFSSFYLEYMTPIGKDARALKDFTKPYNPDSDKNDYLNDYKSIMHFADRVNDYITKHPDELLPEDLNELAPGFFNPQVVEVFNEINNGNIIIEQITLGTYKAYLSQFMFHLKFTEEETRQLEKLLIYFLDFKSTQTMRHAVNTSCYALSLGHRFNLSIDELSELYTSAALHDIGKIATPQRILEFPGRLSPEDMGIMKHHVNHSRRILAGFVPYNILENVYRHHEKLNGEGYPKHVKGDEITTLQRILTVADITSALNDSRSYKTEYSKEKVITIISDMTKEGELDASVSRIIIEEFDQIMLELTELLELIKVDFSKVLANYNAFIVSDSDSSEEIELEELDELDELEEL